MEIHSADLYIYLIAMHLTQWKIIHAMELSNEVKKTSL